MFKNILNWLDKNKEVIGGACLIIADVLPSYTVAHYVLLITGELLTGKAILKMIKDGEFKKLTLNGKKTILGNNMLFLSGLDYQGILIIVGLLGLAIVIVGISHKWLKGEIDNTLPKKLQRMK